MTSNPGPECHPTRPGFPGRVLMLTLGFALAGCAPATPPQEYPALQPIDDLLAQADSAFPEPPP